MITRMPVLHRDTRGRTCVLPGQCCFCVRFNMAWWSVTSKVFSMQRSFVPWINIALKTGTAYSIPCRCALLHDSPVKVSTVGANIALMCIVGDGAEMRSLAWSAGRWLTFSEPTSLQQNKEFIDNFIFTKKSQEMCILFRLCDVSLPIFPFTDWLTTKLTDG